MRVIAVIGLSGIGKSTLITAAKQSLAFMHLQASELIKSERSRLFEDKLSNDDLKSGPVLDNQKLLVTGFQRATADYSGLIVFDGHSIIETPNGLVTIPSWVYKAIGCNQIIYMHAGAEDILSRRRADQTRIRPLPSIDEMIQYQNKSIAAAKNIGIELSIPLDILENLNRQSMLAAFLKLVVSI